VQHVEIPLRNHGRVLEVKIENVAEKEDRRAPGDRREKPDEQRTSFKFARTASIFEMGVREEKSVAG
jgi:hypothetical protein